jgi:hypothetical protein
MIPIIIFSALTILLSIVAGAILYKAVSEELEEGVYYFLVFLILALFCFGVSFSFSHAFKKEIVSIKNKAVKGGAAKWETEKYFDKETGEPKIKTKFVWREK